MNYKLFEIKIFCRTIRRLEGMKQVEVNIRANILNAGN